MQVRFHLQAAQTGNAGAPERRRAKTDQTLPRDEQIGDLIEGVVSFHQSLEKVAEYRHDLVNKLLNEAVLSFQFARWPLI